MTTTLVDPGTVPQDNPLDIVEQVAAQNAWTYDRTDEDEVNLCVAGSWCDYHISMNWREDLSGLHIACALDMRVPQTKRGEVHALLALINEQLWLGHFDIWSEDGVLIFRDGLLLAGGAVATVAQVETLLHLAVEACERYFPAFQFVIWAGKRPEEAVAAALFETRGQA